MRIALGVEYDGTAFSGWQFQENASTVQQAVEYALSKVANHDVRVVCAGRTDTAVHATAQVIHFDTDAQRSERSWCFGANTHLPKGVAILWARPVDDSFHARFSAVKRSYRYVIFNRPIRPTFMAYRVTWEYRPLLESRMQAAAQYLLGEHDFSAFRAAGCQAKTATRQIHAINVQRKRDLVIIDVTANAFLHHMVRNIAGVLMAIGAGEQEVAWCSEVLASRQRKLGGVTAQPHGLYLVDVEYPEHFGIPRLPPTEMIW